jgi:hypothetical protein
VTSDLAEVALRLLWWLDNFLEFMWLMVCILWTLFWTSVISFLVALFAVQATTGSELLGMFAFAVIWFLVAFSRFTKY